MVHDRYNAPVVVNFFDKFFSLQRKYHSTIRDIEDLSGDNLPAGVVADSEDEEKNAGKIRDSMLELEKELLLFERAILPTGIAGQKEIADLLYEVRCYIGYRRE